MVAATDVATRRTTITSRHGRRELHMIGTSKRITFAGLLALGLILFGVGVHLV